MDSLQNGSDRSRSFSMYLLLPDAINGILAFVVGDFRIPKFNVLYGFNASDILQDLWLEFPNLKEFDRDMESPLGEKPFIYHIFHKSFIDVNEEGTEQQL